MEPFVTPIIMGSVLGFLGLLMWAAKRGQPVADLASGTLVFRHSILFRGFSYFAAFVIPLGITLLVIFNPPKKESDVTAIIFIYALFAVLSALCSGSRCASPWSSPLKDWTAVRPGAAGVSFPGMR